ncbi:MAG: hypothetical protein HOG89_01775 [Candidatus Peribacter sp.]|jgi:hypothetical protein|nr:hypothetical protein [Candidatus Peribacter sp.]MBT4392830.1 hypothetical protein [Candidatus Peribacter sp.]MBT4601461.1 hypothetical protein [Candidatus Peribacter sp.]MBT5148778.1 hypothetical protein [Candidatus Peribacter sp.]MBT5637626.1 hypothetical protein [Candidatus Peribacter sp.]
MGSSVDLNTIWAALSVLVGISTVTLYTKSIFSGDTKPHEFTWLIWAITQGTATAILWQAGGGKGAIYLTIGTVIVFAIFILLLFRGSRNITNSDVLVLALALLGFGIWWFLENPLLAVILMSSIDVSGYIPTFRKSYSLPDTETSAFWFAFGATNILSILALENYNALTLTYLVSIAAANISLGLFLIWRRQRTP